ncbi:hypothetical protein B0H14DRAFT_2568772 [Mycena olivaceomarginata]|nr:hypothetical protein B0H14DRAFT_2568772 [Mycena olivaceomarginata]
MDTPRTPPPFKGRTARLPATPVTPFKFDPALTKAVPCGNFLIIRSVYNTGDKKINPVPIVQLKVAEICTSNPAIRDTPVIVTPFNTRDVSTSCYLRLGPALISPDPGAEPRTDLLHDWIDALAPTGWEVSWAPQIEGKDKQMWLRVTEVYEEKHTEGAEDKKKNKKVITVVRKIFDTAGDQTVNAFKSGTGIIVAFALPAHVDEAAAARTISIDGRKLWVNHVRQIEISYAFEIAIGGTTGINETAMHNVCRWFAAFERNGTSLLAEARHPPGEQDYLIVSMHDWATTADVLADTDRFREEITTLLFTLNTTASWRADPTAVITEGAAKVTGTLDLLTCRVETIDHESRTCNAEMKDRLVDINKNITTSWDAVFLLMQKQNQLDATLARINSNLSTAQMAYRLAVDDSERTEIRDDITRLK